jgi:hypothetical protein
MDTDHKEKGSKRGKGSSSCSPGISALKGEQEEACHYDGSILPRRPLYRGEEWNLPPSPTINQPRREKNLFNGNLVDEGTDAEIFDDIMKPESGTRRNLCHEMRYRRWEKPRKNGSLGKEGIPDDVIVGKLKSRPNRRQDNTERTLFSEGT